MVEIDKIENRKGEVIDKMTNEPCLTDVCNVFALTTLKKAEELNKEMFAGMTEVKKFMPSDGTDDGIEVVSHKPKAMKYISDRKILKPIIKGVKVTWGYSEDKVKDAIKIMAILGWKEPVFYCTNKVFPMIVKTGRRYNDSGNEPVLMIAPIIQSE